MDLSGRRRLAALALLGLASVTGCAQAEPESRATEFGDQIPGRVTSLETGKTKAILTPAGRLSVSFADPVTQVSKDDTTDRVSRDAPNGGTFVPMVWSFQGDEIYGEIADLFGDREPLEIELVADDVHYSLTPPPDGSLGRRAQYVAVEGDGEDISLEVTYGTVPQALDIGSNRLYKGVAEDLYNLPRTKIKMQDCPIKEWFREPGVFPQYECRYATAIPSPYVANTWVQPGHTWLAVTVTTNLALYATGELDGTLATYRIVGNTELSTVNGEDPLGTLHKTVTGGSATGTLVFDIKGKLPDTMHVLREYELTLNGASGETDAPERRSVKIGGDLDLFY